MPIRVTLNLITHKKFQFLEDFPLILFYLKAPPKVWGLFKIKWSCFFSSSTTSIKAEPVFLSYWSPVFLKWQLKGGYGYRLHYFGSFTHIILFLFLPIGCNIGHSVRVKILVFNWYQQYKNNLICGAIYKQRSAAILTTSPFILLYFYF